MSRFLKSPAIGLAILAVLGCGETENPLGPCSDVIGCPIAGVDLDVDAVVLWADDQPIDERIEAHLVQPGDTVHILVSVLNRGAEVSDSATLKLLLDDREIDFVVPPLAFAETADTLIELIAPEWPRANANVLTARALLVEIDGDTWTEWERDVEIDNNASAEESIHVDVPVFDTSIDAPDSITIAEPFEAIVRVNIREPLGSANGFVIGFCVFAAEQGCDAAHPGFGLTVIDQIQLFPGTSFSATTRVAVAEFADLDEAIEAGLVACVLPLGSDLDDLHDPVLRACGQALDIVLSPASG